MHDRTTTSTADMEAAEIAAVLQPMIGPLARALRQGNEGPYTVTQLSVIGMVQRHGPINLRDLAERERLSAPMISKIVAALDDAGMVRRIPEPDDKRVCLVELTDQARTWLDEEGHRRSEWLTARLDALSDADRSAISAALPALRRLVDQGD